MVRKGRALYATLFQEVFVCKTGGGGSLNGRIYVDFVSVYRIYTFISETGLLYLLSDFVFLTFKLYLIYKIPVDFARVPSPKMMSDCHMLCMNICDAGRHAGPQRHENGLTFL